MKFLTGLASAAFLYSSAAAAAAASAPFYLLRSASSSSTSSIQEGVEFASPHLPRQIARQIILQRLGANDGSSFYDTLPRNFKPENALDLIRQFGSKEKADFLMETESTANSSPRELLIVIQGVEPKHVAALEAALPSAFAKPALFVVDPPSEVANAGLFIDELAAEGINAHLDTSLVEALAVGVPETWYNGVFVDLFDAKKNTEVVNNIVAAIPQILALVESGDIDASILLLPESSRFAQWKNWVSSKGIKPTSGRIRLPKAQVAPNTELRVREADSELVLTEDNAAPIIVKEEISPVLDSGRNTFAASPIPGCFQSFNSCITATNNCSEHGTCVDKYSVNSGGLVSNKQEAAVSCFVCHCFRTLNRPEDSTGGLSTTQWAGNMCQKQDVSVPFWLITGFTVAIVGAVSFAIGLLFSVGEEKLPGVIGAGVSRAK
ncbi:hypothetical protein SEPCBS57363_003595 [Sporothrix epigloea]|uniref:Vacuolar sorting protein Vps3844 C-terminal domain-containing protein n=1 Tax=Sporothrix epigloea TaxID=1892477 RepID=A0ABP0DNK4_9PEZI